MKINTKVTCPKCETIIDVKDIKRAILYQIEDFIQKEDEE